MAPPFPTKWRGPPAGLLASRILGSPRSGGALSTLAPAGGPNPFAGALQGPVGGGFAGYGAGPLSRAGPGLTGEILPPGRPSRSGIGGSAFDVARRTATDLKTISRTGLSLKFALRFARFFSPWDIFDVMMMARSFGGAGKESYMVDPGDWELAYVCPPCPNTGDHLANPFIVEAPTNRLYAEGFFPVPDSEGDAGFCRFDDLPAAGSPANRYMAVFTKSARLTSGEYTPISNDQRETYRKPDGIPDPRPPSVSQTNAGFVVPVEDPFTYGYPGLPFPHLDAFSDPRSRPGAAPLGLPEKAPVPVAMVPGRSQNPNRAPSEQSSWGPPPGPPGRLGRPGRFPRPPEKRVKEMKVDPGFLRKFTREAINQITEADDFIGCLYDSSVKKKKLSYRPGAPITVFDKAGWLASGNNWRTVDVEAALKCLVVNYFVDKYVGGLYGKAERFNPGFARPGGLSPGWMPGSDAGTYGEKSPFNPRVPDGLRDWWKSDWFDAF